MVTVDSIVEDRMKLKRKNWNLFVGDTEYKTDFFLSFLSPFTDKRFKRDSYHRNRLYVRLSLAISAIFWVIVCYNSSMFWTFFIGMALHVIGGFLIYKRYDLLYIRFFCVLFELLLQGCWKSFCQVDTCFNYISILKTKTFLLGIF